MFLLLRFCCIQLETAFRGISCNLPFQLQFLLLSLATEKNDMGGRGEGRGKDRGKEGGGGKKREEREKDWMIRDERAGEGDRDV